MARPRSLGALREEVAAGRLTHHSVKDEIRGNLIATLRTGRRLFPGIVGYDDTVIPQLVNALLSKHNFILLGLRGQAKTRLLRALTELLDPEIAVVAGCELHDDPLHPLRMAMDDGSLRPTRIELKNGAIELGSANLLPELSPLFTPDSAPATDIAMDLLTKAGLN